jgi:hypothetical protein
MGFPAVANQARQPMAFIFGSTRRSIAIQRRVLCELLSTEQNQQLSQSCNFELHT